MPTGERRVLGFWAAVSIVMGNMIGSGVFLLPSSLAAYRGLIDVCEELAHEGRRRRQDW